MIDVPALARALAAALREDPALRRELAGALGDTTAPATVQHVTVYGYAAAHSLSPSTVRQAIREGRLEAIRVGRAVRIPANAMIRGRRELGMRVDATARAERRLGLIPGGRK